MVSAIKKYQPILWLVGMIAGIIVFAFQSFATKEYVEHARSATLLYVDGKHDKVENQMRAIQSTLDRVDQRIYEIHKEIKR